MEKIPQCIAKQGTNVMLQLIVLNALKILIKLFIYIYTYLYICIIYILIIEVEL